jgi:hypothetical protein
MPSWTGYKDILRQLYPTADPERIVAALGYRFTWRAIQQKANEMGLERQGWSSFRGESPFDSLGYCRACDRWMPFDEIPDDLRCDKIIDNKKCNNKIRMPLRSKYWAYRDQKKKEQEDNV